MNKTEPGNSVSVPIEWYAGDDNIAFQSKIDESNWHNIIGTPHVQRGLHRLAAEARRQAAAGEIEEGGFVFE